MKKPKNKPLEKPTVVTTDEADSKVTNEKPISLYPLSLEDVLSALLQTKPPVKDDVTEDDNEDTLAS